MPLNKQGAIISDNAPDVAYLSDISPHDKPWDVHKSMSLLIADLYRVAGYDRYSQRVLSCSETLLFGLTCEHDLRLEGAAFCRVRNCPICQWRRSMQWQARTFKALPAILEAYPNSRFIFLTLTIRNCPLFELRDNISLLHKAFVRLTQRKIFPGLGWIKSLEVTRSQDDFAHPHIHALIMVSSSYFGKSKNYLSHEKWTDLWQSALRVDYTPIVNVKSIKSKTNIDDKTEALKVALVEVTKYTVKPSDIVKKSNNNIDESDAIWLREFTRQLHKTRLISVGGVFRHFISEAEPEDLVSEEDTGDKHETTLYFDYDKPKRRYRSHQMLSDDE